MILMLLPLNVTYCCVAGSQAAKRKFVRDVPNRSAGFIDKSHGNETKLTPALKFALNVARSDCKTRENSEVLPAASVAVAVTEAFTATVPVSVTVNGALPD